MCHRKQKKILVHEHARRLESTIQVLEGNVFRHEDIQEIFGSFVLPDAAGHIFTLTIILAKRLQISDVAKGSLKLRDVAIH